MDRTVRHIYGFTGTRDGMTTQQLRSLRWLFVRLHATGNTVTRLHHGDCVGADAQAHAMFDRAGKEIVIHPPVDTRLQALCGCTNRARVFIHYPLPYMVRNRVIVDATEALFAAMKHEAPCDDYGGTYRTVQYARSLNRPVSLIRPSGRVEFERWF